MLRPGLSSNPDEPLDSDQITLRTQKVTGEFRTKDSQAIASNQRYAPRSRTAMVTLSQDERTLWYRYASHYMGV